MFTGIAPSFSVPNPPAENPCNAAILPPGVPLAAQPGATQPSTPAAVEPQAQSRSVTVEKDAFPWSLPIGGGAGLLTLGVMAYVNQRRQESNTYRVGTSLRF